MASSDGAPSTFAAMQASLNAGARGSDLALSSDEEDAGRDARDDIDRALDEDRGGAKGDKTRARLGAGQALPLPSETEHHA